MLYNSISNKKIKDLKKLHIKKYRTELFLVEGEHLVIEAYKKGCLKEVLLYETDIDVDVLKHNVSFPVLKYLSELTNPSNMIGICYKKTNEITGNKIVYLDNIQDPGNLGTIIRSCVAFNVDTLILDSCADLYNSKTIRATQGLMFHLNIVQGNSEDIKKLKSEKYTIYGTKLIGGKSLKTIAKNNKFVIIMGNEGQGLSDSISNLCDEFIYIDTNKNCESLNVGVATSIILYEMGD